MGTTIRRQPITNSIPASPDYKFLNITNFGGVQKSSNPFVVSSNTASDCLNVYVDEDNALSTRPRLQPKYDLPKLARLTKYELIGVYNLHDGYLLHVIENNDCKMYKFIESGTGLLNPTQISGTIPETKCVVFEQNEKIYLLTGNEYKNIVDDTISDVIGYVPTTTIGKWEPRVSKTEDGNAFTEYLTAGKTFESKNILSDKYKETYFWDGTWNIADVVEAGDVVENNYVKHTTHKVTSETQWIRDSITILQYMEKASELSDAYNYYLAYVRGWDYDNHYDLVIVTTSKNNEILENLIVSLPISVSDYQGLHVVASSDGKTFAVAPATYPSDISDTKIHIFTRDDAVTSVFRESDIHVPVNPFGDDFVESLNINDNGTMLIFTASNDYAYFMPRKTISENFDRSISPGTDTHYANNIFISKEFGSRVLIELTPFTSENSVKWGYCDFDNNTGNISNVVYLPDFWDSSVGEFVLGIDAVVSPKSVVAEAKVYTKDDVFVYSRIIHIPDLINNPNNKIILDTSYDTPVIKWVDNVKVFNEDYSRVYWGNKSHNRGGWIDLKTNKIYEYVTFDALYLTRPFIREGSVFGLENGLHQDSLNLSSSEPLLTITKKSEATDLKASFLETTLLQRFDNNTWFASGNTTFHTLYNDPTYIPLSSYNDLGEDYEEITGLSIVNDNILAAYKRDKIYIITPIMVGNELTYSYTETKNVVGNDVVGAPILTILTEMPTIVSYDGIYALNQLENVQSSDRITTLISENINPLWLKESKSDIDGCQTLNRLYWTYYILPHEKVNGEKEDYTKVYLLDNRSQQWYYWELPILVSDAFVKDNKTHLIRCNGQIFTLETTDLVGNRPEETEYYDKIDKTKMIIPWHWHSQILSLNTINYAKRLIDTTFILTDTDTQDEYGLDYSFKAWRKSVSETNATTISSNINYVQSTTKRTMIPRFNFIQIRLSNTEKDEDNNKLRLVGLGLKYVLLEGLY